MNMTSDPHCCETISTFQPLSNIMARTTSVRSRETSGVDQQSLRWSAYAAAAECAQQTGSRDDQKRASEAWLDFLLAYLPRVDQRSQIPMPAYLRLAKQQARL
jgi:hypothetical protein